MLGRRSNHPRILLAACAAALVAASVPAAAFSPPARAAAAAGSRPAGVACQWERRSTTDERCVDQDDAISASSTCIDTEHDRRSFLSRSGAAAWIAGAGIASVPGAALADDDSTDSTSESIASRAARLSKVVADEQTQALEEAEIASPTTVPSSSSSAEGGGGAPADTRSMYDFALPMQGFDTPMTDLLGRSDKGDDGAKKQPKVVLFVNIKQDDVVARKNIPELIALASKFGREGDFAVVCSPTDQGYYEVRLYSFRPAGKILSLVGMNSSSEFDILFLILFIHSTFVYFAQAARHLPAHSAEAGPGIRIRDQPRHHRYR